MGEKKIGLALLREPFPANLISKLPKPTCKSADWKKLPKGKCKECGGYHATSKTIHLDYVGHAALTDRLLDCDPEWSWEPLAYTDGGLPRFDESGGLWIKLTVCGVTRIGYGHAKDNQYAEIGSREKEVIGDALRNAAMRGGAALDLWHKGDLYLPENEELEEKVDKHNKEIAVSNEYSDHVDKFDKCANADEAIQYWESVQGKIKDPKLIIKVKKYCDQRVDTFNS
jgi:hypothetical protein